MYRKTSEGPQNRKIGIARIIPVYVCKDKTFRYSQHKKLDHTFYFLHQQRITTKTKTKHNHKDTIMMDYDTTTTTTSTSSNKTTPVVTVTNQQPQHHYYEAAFAFTPASSLCELILENSDGECDYFNSSCMSLSYDEVEQSNFDDEKELTDCGGWMQYMILLLIGTFFCYGLQLVKCMNSIRFTFTTTATVTSNIPRKQQKMNAPIKPQQQHQQPPSSPRTIQDVVQQAAVAANQTDNAPQQQQRNSWGLPSSLSFHFRVLMLWIVASAVTNACKC